MKMIYSFRFWAFIQVVCFLVILSWTMIPVWSWLWIAAIFEGMHQFFSYMSRNFEPPQRRL